MHGPAGDWKEGCPGMSQVALRRRVEHAVPRPRPKRCCIFLLGSEGLKGPDHPLLRMLGDGVGRDGRRAGLGTCHLIFLFREETSLSWKEGALEPPGRGALSGPGVHSRSPGSGAWAGGGQPPPRPRGGSLPLPHVLIWATGSALSGEPRGRAPARLRKVQQEQESEAEEEEASASAGALKADRPDPGA